MTTEAHDSCTNRCIWSDGGGDRGEWPVEGLPPTPVQHVTLTPKEGRAERISAQNPHKITTIAPHAPSNPAWPSPSQNKYRNSSHASTLPSMLRADEGRGGPQPRQETGAEMTHQQRHPPARLLGSHGSRDLTISRGLFGAIMQMICIEGVVGRWLGGGWEGVGRGLGGG